MRKLVLYASQIGIWNTHTYTQIYTVICTEIYTQIYAQISVLNVAFAAAHHCSSVAVAVISHVAKIYGFHLLVACGSQCQQQQPATTKTTTTVTTTKLNSALAAASAAPAMIDH